MKLHQKINLKNNTALKVLSLAVAIVIWFVIGNINDPVRTVVFSGIPVKVINEEVLKSIDKEYEIIEGGTVAISVRGKSSVVEGLRAEDFYATADLEKLSVVNAVPIDVQVSRNSSQLDISLGRVNTLKVKIENRAETMIPVVVETTGEVAQGYAIGSKTSSPNMIEVAGSESMIKRLKEIRVTVDVENASEDRFIRQSVKFYDQNGDPVDDALIDCDTAAVDVTVELWKTKEIPLYLNTAGVPATGYGVVAFDYEPKTLVIAADDDKLDSISGWEMETIDISGVSENLEKTISIDSSVLPNGVVFKAGTVDIVAKAVIEKKVSTKVRINAADIEVRGLMQGKTITFDKSYYDVDVESFDSKIGNLTSAAFEPYIDVASLNGKTTGKLRIHLINPQGATVSNTVTVQVTIGNE